MKHVFLSANIGIGKSTIIQKLIRNLNLNQEKIGGFYTKAYIKGNELICIDYSNNDKINDKGKYKRGGSAMEIKFTKEQYRKLLDIVYAGITVINGNREIDQHLEEYEKIVQYLYSFASQYGFDSLVYYNKDHKKYFTTQKFEENIEKLMEEFEEKNFLETLSLKLAQRDIADEIEGQVQIDKELVLQRLIERQARYKEEFQENGLQHLRFNKKAHIKSFNLQDKSEKIEGEGRILQLHIRLKDINPIIWRRILVKEEMNFYTFNQIIQKVMGWSGFQQYEFQIHGQCISEQTQEDLWEEYTEIISPKEKTLAEYFLQPNDFFTYTYDFGDNWVHEILVEDIYEQEEKRKYPVCLDGERRGPVENIGGPWGYMELLNIIENPEDPQYQQVIEWLGQDFDPEQFDINRINKELMEI
ncbi:IS1096 element passenger TnpR family protein [Garciella nitratireducens]|uniref:IS1096 element passenger TnpR family protein n=1 Tax=Garciella nitratireducens TaxID=218205 RepID=UPI001BD68FDA|nr:nucleoside-triphosphatase [Garciella nitratireducens]